MKIEDKKEILEFVRDVKCILKWTWILGLPTALACFLYYMTPSESLGFGNGVYIGWTWWVGVLMFYYGSRW